MALRCQTTFARTTLFVAIPRPDSICGASNQSPRPTLLYVDTLRGRCCTRQVQSQRSVTRDPSAQHLHAGAPICELDDHCGCFTPAMAACVQHSGRFSTIYVLPCCFGRHLNGYCRSTSSRVFCLSRVLFVLLVS